MNKIAVILILFLSVYGCDRDIVILDNYVVGEIVNFDLNCQTCILKFPNDSLAIKREIGPSKNNYYKAINQMKDTFKINQKVLVKLRKAEENELRGCITFYISYDYSNIFVIDFKPFNIE